MKYKRVERGLSEAAILPHVCWFIPLEMLGSVILNFNLTRVEATISSHLRGLRKLWRRIRQCKLFQGRTIKIMRSVKEIKMLFINQNYCEFLKPEVGLNILPMLRVCHSRSFLFTLALKTKTCVMPLLVPALSKFSPSPIKFMVPYKLPMGS